jgi:hypothetical protein
MARGFFISVLSNCRISGKSKGKKNLAIKKINYD